MTRVLRLADAQEERRRSKCAAWREVGQMLAGGLPPEVVWTIARMDRMDWEVVDALEVMIAAISPPTDDSRLLFEVLATR